MNDTCQCAVFKNDMAKVKIRNLAHLLTSGGLALDLFCLPIRPYRFFAKN